MVKLVAALCIAILCSSPVIAATHTLQGEVTYRERIALPDLAILRIQLVDQTIASAPPRIDVQGPIGAGQPPLAFNLTFEDSMILPGHTYALIATISAEGGLMFRNFQPYPVDPLAPAGPIAIVTNFVAPSQEGAAPSEPASPEDPAILDTVWVATSIGEMPVVQRSKTTLQIGPDMRAGGIGGCNSWFAEAKIAHDTIRFGSITSTMKACTQSINLQEQAFHQALAAAATWQVVGETLTLYGADGKALVVFSR